VIAILFYITIYKMWKSSKSKKHFETRANIVGSTDIMYRWHAYPVLSSLSFLLWFLYSWDQHVQHKLNPIACDAAVWWHASCNTHTHRHTHEMVLMKTRVDTPRCHIVRLKGW